MDIQHALQDAVSLHRSGRFTEAGDIYRDIISENPGQPDALHLLGLISLQSNRIEEAIEFIERAIANESGRGQFYNSLGNARKQNGDFQAAITGYRMAIAQIPQYAEAYFNLGNTYQQIGELANAVSAYEGAINFRPGFSRAHNNLAVACQSLGDFKKALEHYRLSVTHDPEYFEAYHNLGNVLIELERYEEAVQSYGRALNLDPKRAEVHASLGHAFQLMGQPDDAVGAYKAAISLAPKFAEAFNDLGTAYRDLGKLESAMQCFKKCAALKPGDALAFNNMGIILKETEQYRDAVSCYKKAIALNPSFAEGHYNLGNVYGKLQEPETAIECYRNALRLKPDYGDALGLMIRQMQQICDWQDLTSNIRLIHRLTEKQLNAGKRAAESPFLAFSLSDEPAYNFKVARSWATSIASMVRLSTSKKTFDHKLRGGGDSRKCGKIVVGYLSSDFKNHATAHLMLSLFGLHDRRHFSIYAYSYGKNDGSHYREKIMTACDRFTDISKLSDKEAARRIYEDKVDILVELKGYTEGNRFEICAFRPAPVQVSYLGFPGTTGADFIDYIITDKVITPPDQASYFAEKFVYMPHSYQVNDSGQKISNERFTRQDFGLPENGFVFCSFNEPYKIEPVMFDVWMKILRQVPDGVLWLLMKSSVTMSNLREQAEKRGIAPERLVFSGTIDKKRHLARLRLADLYLDTRIVNGHTTTSDALWAGIPVVTIVGTHFASRVSASLVHALGLDSLVTANLQEYEKLAVDIALKRDLRKNVSEKLSANRLRYPLFDTQRFAANLEHAYRLIWKNYSAGKEAEEIYVPDHYEKEQFNSSSRWKGAPVNEIRRTDV